MKSKRNSTWKSIERLLARYLGGERVPITGRTRGSSPDIEKSNKISNLEVPAPLKKILDRGTIFDTHVFEIKHRKSIPNYLLNIKEACEFENNTSRYLICSLEQFRDSFIDGFDLQTINPIEFPEWILDAFDQAEKANKSKIPTVILHQKNQRIKDSILCLKFSV